MADAIVSFFSGIIQNEYLLFSFLTALPITEIKGSLMLAAAYKADPLLSYAVCLASSFALSAVLCFLFPKFFRLLERFPKIRKISSFLTDRLEEKAIRLEKKASESSLERKSKLTLGLFCFVALPLPLTGLWAGALLAAIMRLSFKDSFFALSMGNLTAGGIVLFVLLLAGDRASIVLNAFLIAALSALVLTIGKGIIKRKKKAS